MVEILRYAAFTTDPAAGNPAGVVLDASGLTDSQMLAIAAEVGYSETAFLFPDQRDGEGAMPVRYFSPLAEVAFCGHATIATSVAWAEHRRPEQLVLATAAGLVPVDVAVDGDAITATLTSVEPQVQPLDEPDRVRLLESLRLESDALDSTLPVSVAYAGLWHPVIPLATRARLAALDYDFDALAELMALRQWTTVAVLWRQAPDVLHVRNPFPPGGVVEDPATGAAGAAIGGYLRAIDAITPPATLTIHQGEDMGRPSTLIVEVGRSGGIRVSGTAVRIR